MPKQEKWLRMRMITRMKASLMMISMIMMTMMMKKAIRMVMTAMTRKIAMT